MDYYRDRVCVPNDDELKKPILEEAHSGSFAIHLGSTKMYQDLKTSYWWSGMKKDGSDLVTYGVLEGESGTSNSFGFVAAY